jgi:acetyl esterase/lipase
MPKHRYGPWVAASLLAALLAVLGVTLWPDGGDDQSIAPYVNADAVLTPASMPRPGVEPNRCGVVTFTPPRASDSHRGDLCRPGRTARGGVILVHGGGGYGGHRSAMREWAAWYRSEGFVTLAIDYTLLGDGSPEPVYPRPERDMKAAIQWMHLQAERLGFDHHRIVLHGSSAGARLAAQAFVTPGDDYFENRDLWPDAPDDALAMVGFYGYYDGDTLEAERYYGGLADSADRRVRARWRHADSVSQAAGAPGPVLLFHGDVDGLITVAQTERFGAALAEVGADVTAYIVTDANHAFDGRSGDLTTETGAAAADEIANWLDDRFPR